MLAVAAARAAGELGERSVDGETLRGIVAELCGRPGHEKVRALVHRLLTDGLGASSSQIDFERRIPEARGAVDALLGRTIFEFKSDLRHEAGEAQKQLGRYLPARESKTGERYIGIAADGARFETFAMRGDALHPLGGFSPSPEQPREFLVWLESVVVMQDELSPDIHVVCQELGRESATFARAMLEIESLWGEVGARPESRLKRDLWRRLLRLAYGAEVGDDRLFFQHTYLNAVAKSVAWAALAGSFPDDGAALLGGKAFRDLGISGVVESDFFDWILQAEGGGALVQTIARQAMRFRLHDIQSDILKGLYESLIDPAARHDLGEYYTPDWLAARVCEAAIADPLRDRVMDPACGSGTFLFHAIRKLLAAAEEGGVSPAEAVARCARNIAGIDVHPVAVIFARITYVLALMPALQQSRSRDLNVPVYLGDSLQWDVVNGGEGGLFKTGDNLEVYVPPGEGGESSRHLRFPSSAAGRDIFDGLIEVMLEHSERTAPSSEMDDWLQHQPGLNEDERATLLDTYENLLQLCNESRNHIWGYVARNAARPVWLATEEHRADVVIGNPPWVAYRAMQPETQRTFRRECEKGGLWVGGKLATAQDLSAYFFSRAAALYMRRQGRIAMVMPLAALTRAPYEKFRAGALVQRGESNGLVLRFTAAWQFDSDVQPLFPVPCCVLFAHLRSTEEAKTTAEHTLPSHLRAFSGQLPRRDASEEQAARVLREIEIAWPSAPSSDTGSPYRSRFRNGASLVPRRLVLVERTSPPGPILQSPVVPYVRSRVGNSDKAPWKNLQPLEGMIEAEFLRPVLLGESIAPYRLLRRFEGVIPWDEELGVLLDSAAARKDGHRFLSLWLKEAEIFWNTHRKGDLTFIKKLDYYRKLSSQFPIAKLRVVYSASGTLPCAAVLRGSDNCVVEHALYYCACRTLREARYLTAILNSETLRKRVERYQARGQWGARHFDKYVFNLPIPIFDARDSLHTELADAARRAEAVAAKVKLAEGIYFTRARKLIREALADASAATEVETRVARLLG